MKNKDIVKEHNHRFREGKESYGLRLSWLSGLGQESRCMNDLASLKNTHQVIQALQTPSQDGIHGGGRQEGKINS